MSATDVQPRASRFVLRPAIPICQTDLPLDWYEDLFHAIKARYPDFKLHALSPPEIIHLSRMARLPVPEVIGRLIRKGAHARLILSVDLIGQAVSVEVDAADVRQY